MSLIRLMLVITLVLSFSFNAYAGGAGVCVLFDDDTILLGKEQRYCQKTKTSIEVWNEFGGGTEENETPAQTAYREFLEETGHYTFGNGSPYNIQLNDIMEAEKKGEYADRTTKSGSSYRCYFLRIHGQKPDIQMIVQNAILAVQNLGDNAHVGKNEWRYFDAQIVKRAPWNEGALPGTDKRLYGSTMEIIQQTAAQNFLKNY